MRELELQLKYPKHYAVNDYLSSIFKEPQRIKVVLDKAFAELSDTQKNGYGSQASRSLSLLIPEGMPYEKREESVRLLAISVLEVTLEEDLGDIADQDELIRYLTDDRNFEAAVSRRAKLRKTQRTFSSNASFCLAQHWCDAHYEAGACFHSFAGGTPCITACAKHRKRSKTDS